MMKKLLIKIKYYFEKGALSWGIMFLVISTFYVWFWKPAFFYAQHTGIVQNIEESKYSTILSRMNNPITLDIFIFYINGEKYNITKIGNENYDYLIGQEILFRFDTTLDKSKHLQEIIYNGQIITSINEYNGRFIKWIIYFLICLSWVAWGVIKQWKNSSTTVKEKKNNDEEFFYDNWGIRKKNDKCTLTYISKLDGNVKHIKISMDDYIAAKTGKMNLDNFSEKYQLW